ncbi:cadherin domain-containing protein [uncultured Aquimarina sp.]|uniref:cadherin domain-containing protein n=1 Tax=uncultured Aquimarina sp. TaxID=575652 RepID=UPI0026182C5E|nr:cadherin domain-containing protein [uncultured Aquimarina sp.]
MKKILLKTFVIAIIIFVSCSKDDDNTPINTPPTISTQSFTVSEALESGGMVGTVLATDANDDELTFTITTNSNALFTIDNAGTIKLAQNGELDFETTPVHSITVGVSDGKATVSAEITINVTDANENTTPEIEDVTFEVAEDIDDTFIIGIVTATDAENQTLQFSLVNPTAHNSLFEITSSGELSLASGKSLDYETTTQYTIEVKVTDGQDEATATVTIEVTDVNENVVPEIDNVTFEAAENIDDTVIIGTVTATDAENDPLQFSLVDPTVYSSLFELTTSGNLSLTTGNSLDYETTTQYAIQVNVSDGINDAQAIITLDVTNIIEVTVEIVAGSTTNASGTADGIGTAARFNIPADVTLNTDGSLYVSDRAISLIRAIDGNASVTTYAGGGPTNADGIGTAAGFSGPVGIDNNTNGEIYVADSQSHIIRKIVAGADVTTFAGDTGTNGFVDGDLTDARFASPSGLAIATDGTIYIADRGNHVIRKISNGMVTTLAGNGSAGFTDGQGASASFNLPYSIDVDSEGNIYVADQGNHSIRKITPSGAVTTIAGNGSAGLENGPGQDAKFSGTIRGITVDDNGNVYVSDTSNQVIRMLINNGGSYDVITLAGLANNAGYMDGDGSIAQFFNPAGITYTSNNILYVTEEGGNRVRKIIVE